MHPRLLRLLVLSGFAWLATEAGGEEQIPPDNRASQKALAGLGGSLQWDAEGNVWKAEFIRVPLTDRDLAHVRGLRQLEILTLTGTQVSDAGLVNLARLAHLRVLSLDGTAVTDEGLQHLTTLPALAHLDLSRTVVSDAGLARLKPIQSLESLALNGTQVTDAGLVHLKELPKLYRLSLAQHATESFSIVSKQKPGEPARLAAVPNITTPPPGKTTITAAGLVHIGQMVQLEHLDLNGSQVTDAGLAHLKGLSKLEHLFLDHTRIGDAGLAHLAGLTQLKWLWLEGTQVTDAGLAHLRDLTNLEMLLLSNTRVTNRGLRHLEGLASLGHLTLEETEVNEEGVARLREALPRLHSVDYPRLPFDFDGAHAANEALEMVRAGDLAGFRALVDKDRGNLSAKWTSFGKGDLLEGGMTALHFASQNGDLPMLHFLLQRGADVMAGNQMGTTPLHYAANATVAEALLAAGADLRARNHGGATPLHFAPNRGVAEVLLDHGADVNDRADALGLPSNHAPSRDAGRRNGKTPLHIAADCGRLDVVDVLIEHGAELDAIASGDTALYWAAMQGHVDMVRLLLDQGARPNVGDGSPLEAAIQHNHPDIVRLLFEKDAAVPPSSDSGWTLLHTAAFYGCEGEIVEMLLKAGVPVDARTQDLEPQFWSSDVPPDERPPVTGRRTPLHVAAERGSLSAARALIAHGADIHAKTTDGETAASLTTRAETYEFNPWVGGTRGIVKSWNNRVRQEIEARNAGRQGIAELLQETEQ